MTDDWESYTPPEDEYILWTRDVFEQHKMEVFTWSGKTTVYRYDEWLETNEDFLKEQWKSDISLDNT